LGVDGASGTHYYVYMSGKGTTASAMANSINSLSGATIPLSNFGVRGQTNQVTRSCIYRYMKNYTTLAYEMFDGVCRGGGVPPQPHKDKCTLTIANNTVDFGKISNDAFFKAGRNGTPAGVNAQTRKLNIRCENSVSSGHYVLLKTASKSGDYVQSSIKSIGFLIKSSNAGKITPNDTTSSVKIPSSTTRDSYLDIDIAPINITGEKPVAGEFSATATFEVQFD
ncbi:hypothetical protein ERD95_15015, partial [Enterobacteriaceae bacterium ML5]